jgi:serine protease DegQ
VLKKFWLLFAQACTLCVAALFVVATLRPDLLPRLAGKPGNVVLLQSATQPAAPGVASYAEAARKAMPAVVNIYTTKAVRARNPLLDDSFIRQYFPELAQRIPQRQVTRAPTTSSWCSPTAASCMRACAASTPNRTWPC